MDTNGSLLEPLLERAEQYSKTSFELLKLKSLDKTAAVASVLLSRLLLVITLSLCLLTLTIAFALWAGELFGKNYYGFLLIALLYGLAGIILFFIHPRIKARVNNSILAHMIN